MRIGTSRSDRIGFVVFVVLASLLAVLVITNVNSDPTDSAQEVSTFADLPPAATAVPTTEAIAMPTATPVPAPIVPLAAPVEEAVDADSDDDAANDEASTTDGDAGDEGTAQTASAGASQTTTAAPAASTESSSSGTVPNPQPQAPAATAVPNPQLPADAATAVPNPQLPADAATAVPNPQMPASGATAVPNPQPGTAAAVPANIPADAPQGGSFTRTLTAKNTGSTYNVGLYSTPGGSQFMPAFNGTSLPGQNPTYFGNPLVYRVIAGEPGDAWAKVYVPARPNGTTAWVQTSQFNWGSSNRMIQINISNNTVTVFEGSSVLLTTSAVTGKSSSPTPRANGWVEEIMAGPSSAYGPRLISLGIFSDALNSFGGNLPKVALHGTSSPGLMGQYASNGCIRVENSVISQIAGMIPVGSKVQIVG